VFGIHRVAGRADVFEPKEVERVAKHVSAAVVQAAALFYDNQSCLRAAALFIAGRRGREFGDGDTWWVPYGPDGELVLDGPRFRLGELRPDEEYDCVFSAIDAALEAVGAYPQVSGKHLLEAFCYEKRTTLAESGNSAEQGDAVDRPRE
jgi:hypothetical protein